VAEGFDLASLGTVFVKVPLLQWRTPRLPARVTEALALVRLTHSAYPSRQSLSDNTTFGTKGRLEPLVLRTR